MKKNKIENIMFVAIIFLILIGGLSKPFIKPSDINGTENRLAYQIPQFNFSTFIDKTYQDSFEKALSDQIPLSNTMKLTNKSLNSFIKIKYYQMLKPDGYYNLGSGISLIDDYLLYPPSTMDKTSLDSRISNINEISKRLKDTKFYLYYIEREIDINFENGYKNRFYEYIKSSLNPDVKTSNFEINNFDEYKDYFYKTDHHWNYNGSYKAYLELLNLMNLNNPLTPTEQICINSRFIGSKSRLVGDFKNFNEQFCANVFDFPLHKIYHNNVLIDNYGSYNNIIKNIPAEVSYGNFYGPDYGFLSFDYNQPEKENLLIIGESYDNAINELLASHYNKTYNVDLRNYESEVGSKFNIDKFIYEHDIDSVLLIGNLNFFVMPDFIIKGED